MIQEFSNENNGLFFNRRKELEFLKQALFETPSKSVIIWGPAGIGKTALWRFFYEQNKNSFEGVHVLSSELYRIDSLAEVNFIHPNCLIVVDDPGTLSESEIANSYEVVISRWPNNPKIFCSRKATSFDFKKNLPTLILPLEPFSIQESIALIRRLIPHKSLSPDQLDQLVNQSNGLPLLLRLFGEYAKSNQPFSWSRIRNALVHGISVPGLVDLSGEPLKESSSELKHIIQDVRVVNRSLVDLIAKNPKGMHDLSPRQFEEFVRELLEKMNYKTELTKISRDGGKDIMVAENSELGNFVYYVECKRHSPTNPVSVRIVRELYGTVMADRVTAGIIVTSSYFSPDAIDFTNQIKHQVSLADYLKLCGWLNKISPK